MLRKIICIITTILLFTCFSAFTLPKTDRTLTICVGGHTFIYSYPQIDVCDGEFYLKNIDGIVDEIFYSTRVLPKPATRKLISKNQIKYTERISGEQIDKTELKNGIINALSQGKQTVVISAKPTFCDTDIIALKNRTVKRAEFFTDYSLSQEERKNNIAIACKKINGYELGSGEEFSFNQVVGRRTIENGFQTAKVILDGKFQDGVGGGVCQVSSTLYNGAILSGMTITEFHSHSLAVSYVEKGFDAMVSYPNSDLKFVNDTGEDVLIECVADGKQIYVCFYGVKNNFTYERISEITSVIKPDGEEIIYTKEIPFGDSRILTFEKEGYKTKSYIKTYLKGEYLGIKQIRSDTYKSVKKVIEVGL